MTTLTQVKDRQEVEVPFHGYYHSEASDMIEDVGLENTINEIQ